VVKNAGKAIGWFATGLGVASMLATIIYDWLPTSSRVALACTLSIIAVACFLRGYQLWPRNSSSEDEAKSKKKGPIVRLEFRRDSHSPQHVCVVAVNDGDLAAINVTGECILRNGAIVIEFGPANVGVTSEPTLIPMRWFSGGRQQQTRDPYAFSDPPPECEFQTDTLKALLGAAIGEFTGGAGSPFVGPPRPEPLAYKFDITYTDPAQSERYYRTHILRYSSDTLRIDVDEIPGSAT